ncbi:unnamed protein product [Prorocentrum cordatum]|uniref:Uncharacterized protein n=1 Tax=Prorocentrum cordatum TaxID=2364126 RepID=A0ABN9QTE8_9DINO|nr:unnamed protein product [Polarella glacialis]
MASSDPRGCLGSDWRRLWRRPWGVQRRAKESARSSDSLCCSHVATRQCPTTLVLSLVLAPGAHSLGPRDRPHRLLGRRTDPGGAEATTPRGPRLPRSRAAGAREQRAEPRGARQAPGIGDRSLAGRGFRGAGQALATPYRVALGLAHGTPRHYAFALPEGGRRAYISDIYASLNEAGEMLPQEECELVVQEALLAFRHNIDVYSEEPLYLDAARGVANMCSGYVASRVRACETMWRSS